MALAKTLPSNKSKQVRRTQSGVKQGVGDDPHMVVGGTGGGSTQWLGRSLVDFNFGGAWTDVKRIVKIELAVKTCTTSTHFTYGSKPRIRIERATTGWTEGSGGEGAWSNGEYAWPLFASPGAEVDIPIDPATGTAQGENWVFADITDVVKNWVPSGILMPDGTPGGNGGSAGLSVRLPTETSLAQRAIFYSFDHPTAANRPYIRVTYDPVNQPPNAPTLTGPALTNVSFADSFEGDHSDPDLDPMNAREIDVYLKGGATAAWTLPANLQRAGSGETSTGHFSVPLSLAIGVLKLQTDYEWVARTQDPSGAWGGFSPRRALRITSSAPTIVASNLTTIAAMANALFGGAYNDPEGDLLAGYQMQMQLAAAHTDLAFSDPTTLVWDTGPDLPTASEITAKAISRHYEGRAIAAGNYTYRIRAQDATGVWSAWSYDDFSLTADYNIDPGAIDLQTMIARNAPVRIALYAMGPKRGPGALIGYIDDPIDLGGSAYLNGAGELYFTLPALHPYCPSVEPQSTHYAVQQYYGDRYRTLPEFSGLITDFDAVVDSMVAYGTNYVGLLMTAIDERYDPAKADVAAPVGSKYNDQTVDAIIRDQLTYHKGIANSPVGFINIGPMSVIAERATIYATYAEALPFITGLIDSHKGGTGRECRFYARQVSGSGLTSLAAGAAVGATNIKVVATTGFAVGDVFSLADNDVHQITAVGTVGSGGTGITFTGGLVAPHLVGEPVTEVAWEWALVDAWGHDRPNIMLEYGGLINDFRIVALGDFATRVLAVGQKRGEVKVYRAVGTGGLDEAQWGRRAKTAFFPDIIDQNDLQRRANENAYQLSKVGKRMALAIEADALVPFDGWDLGDSIAINIVRGVVDTSLYGSLGLWTIYGLEWRYSPDGHSELNLTILPKKGTTPPSPDLIPSANPGLSKEWQVGYGKPTIYGSPPVHS